MAGMAGCRGIDGVAEVDLPREKLERVGPEALADEELLAILLRTGYEGMNVLEVSRAILQAHGPGDLLDLNLEGLTGIKGIGRAKGAGLVAGFEFARRALKQGMGIAPSISHPCDAVGLLADIKDRRKEHFVAIFLNARNQIICREEVSIGSLNASLVHPREVFMPAVGSAAASVILAHNHPSGDVTPSREDIELTRRMVQAGEIMGIEVLDHIIIGAERFLSMKEANLF
jgi:DNA repair protein RadC